MSAGYTTTPLAKKLGLKPGYHVKIINMPSHYFDLFDDLPDALHLNGSSKHKKNLIHFFVTQKKELDKTLPQLRGEILPDGIIWVSWPKKAAKAATDITENTIRELALATGLVDVKVCAVDETWSGLKLVIPVKDREAVKKAIS